MKRVANVDLLVGEEGDGDGVEWHITTIIAATPDENGIEGHRKDASSLTIAGANIRACFEETGKTNLLSVDNRAGGRLISHHVVGAGTDGLEFMAVVFFN